MAWITGADVLASVGCPPGLTAVQAQDAADAACATVDRWCGRSLEPATYREWAGRVGPRTLMVKANPIRRLYRACVDYQLGISLQNTSADANAATVSIQDGEMHLTVQGGANDSTDTLTLSNYATMALLLAAIVALAHDWTGTVENEGDPQDLRPENLGDSMSPVTVYPILPAVAAEVSLIERDAGLIFVNSGWPAGSYACFVHYDGGLASIPADLEAITKRLAIDMLREAKRDGTLQSERLDNYAWSRRSDATDLRAVYRKQLQPWRRESIPDVDDCYGD